MRLLSVGKSRFAKLSKAKKSNTWNCPHDMRFVPKKKVKPATAKRALVFDFLNKIYTQVAEPIPDSQASNKRPRTQGNKYDRKDMDRGLIRQLPPGSLQDYYRMCQAELQGQHVSYKLFCSAAWLHFVAFSVVAFIYL